MFLLYNVNLKSDYSNISLSNVVKSTTSKLCLCPWLTHRVKSPQQIFALHVGFFSGLPVPAEWCWVWARFSRLWNGERSPEWPVCLTKCFSCPFFSICFRGLFTAPQHPTLSHNSSLLSLILDHMGDVMRRLDVCADAFCLWWRCTKLNCCHF